MTDAGRLRVLALAVMGLATVLVAASRMVGRLAVEPDTGAGHRSFGGEEPAAPGRADATGGTAPDLSFYRKLGVTGPDAADDGSQPERLRADPDESAAARGAFVVQVLATRDRQRAHRLRKRLAGRGLPAVVVDGQLGGERIYRVRVGRYRERRVAVRWAERLRVEEGLTPWVLQETRSR